MKTVTLKVPDALNARLEEFRRRWSLKKSEIIRRALEEYLVRSGSPAPGSVLEAARDLAGCLEGPRDLSVNPRHLDKYGE